MAELIAYLRVPVAGPGCDVGIDEQRRAITSWARRRRHQLTSFVEEGPSAALEEREGLTAVLAALRDEAADGVVVFAVACLDEDLVTQEQLLAEVRRLKTGVYSVNPDDAAVLRKVPSDPKRRAVREVVMAVSANERSMMALRSASARPPGGAPPYGYRSNDGNLEPDPTEQAALNRITELRASGATLREIARQLHVEGYQPKRSKRWHPESVRRIVERFEA